MKRSESGTFLLELDSTDATLDLVGGKGASLARLASAGLPVPPGFHVTTCAYRRFVTDNHIAEAIVAAAVQANPDDPATFESSSKQIKSIIEQSSISSEMAGSIRQWYVGLGSDNPAVAVRSSATAEDLPELSFAGQQETFLNVRGCDDLLAAVKACWASLWTSRAMEYRARWGVPPEGIAMAVVVQQLVDADRSGVLFTANPITGQRDRATINAAWGLGEAIVSGSVTPDTFIVNKQTGTIESRQIADKKVMTVRLPGGTHEEPVPHNKRKQASLTEAELTELLQLGTRIEQLYGQPMDIEWAMRDGRFFIVQARPITALPEPKTTLDWKLPRSNGHYARGSIIELLPDPLSPLYATLALPIWSESLRVLMERYRLSAMFSYPFFLTINDYAYYDMTLGFWQSVRTALTIPLLIPMSIRRLRQGASEWKDEARPRYKGVIASWAARDPVAIGASELLQAAREIVRAAADQYATIQSSIIPAANASEGLFTAAYNRLARRKGDPPALTFLLGFDSTPILAEKSLYDLAMWARSQPDLAAYLERASSSEISTQYESKSSPVCDAESWHEFSRRFTEHLDRFGHAVYDLDFAKSVPADEPALALETLKYFVAERIGDPYERQAAAAAGREQATRSLFDRLKGLRLRLFKRLLPWAQYCVPLREDALADVGLGWPLLRRLLREFGQRLVAEGAFSARDDVFWLTVDEAEAAARSLDEGRLLGDCRQVIVERRSRWDHERAVRPPVALPVKGARFLGIDMRRFMPARSTQAAGCTIEGQGASPGRVTGVARVILGQEDFNQMHPGDILVAKITTPAWTPLFALASGVVTDVGGMLSHSSIVAREYHVPAVLGTGVATERIHSGQLIAVDGDRGVVTIGDKSRTLQNGGANR